MKNSFKKLVFAISFLLVLGFIFESCTKENVSKEDINSQISERTEKDSASDIENFITWESALNEYYTEKCTKPDKNDVHSIEINPNLDLNVTI